MPKAPAQIVHSSKLSKLIQLHLKNLDWNEVDLCEAVGKISGREKRKLSPAHLTRWQSGERGVSRFLVVRIATALALEYEQRLLEGKKPRKPKEIEDWLPKGTEDLTTDGLDYADWVLQEFLAAAGYVGGTIQVAEPRDVEWAKIKESKQVVIGWTNCPPWCVETPDGPKGPAIEITRQAVKLLCLNPQFTPAPLRWDGLAPAIREREVQLVVPILMKAPWRRSDFLFSSPVSTTEFGIKVVGRKTDLKPGSDLKTFQLGFVAQEIGYLAFFLLSPHHEFVVHDDAKSSIEWIAEKQTRVPRLLASEENTCDSIAEKHPHLVSQSPPELTGKTFTLAFGLHPNESEFAAALNDCIELLKNEFDRQIKSCLPTSGAKK